MNLGELEFTADDFMGEADDWLLDPLQASLVADRANALLRARLEKAVTVYTCDAIVKGNWCEHRF